MTIEAVDRTGPRAAARRRDEALGVVGSLRRLDWVLLAAVGAIVGYGLWAIGGITRTTPAARASRQVIYAVAGCVLLVVATPDRPRGLPAVQASALRRPRSA